MYKRKTNRKNRSDRFADYWLVRWLYLYKGYGLRQTCDRTSYSFSGVRNLLKDETRTGESSPTHPDGNAKTRQKDPSDPRYQRAAAYYWENVEKRRKIARDRHKRYKEECPEKIQVHRDLAVWRCKNDPEARARSIARQQRYMQSDKGKAWLERHKNTWFGKRNILIFVLEKPCVDCGEIDKGLLECDHIIPRFAGGTDDWWNLTVRCKCCHKIKTKEDFITYQYYM